MGVSVHGRIFRSLQLLRLSRLWLSQPRDHDLRPAVEISTGMACRPVVRLARAARGATPSYLFWAHATDASGFRWLRDR